MANAVANRLHRSSAANYNCNYDLRTANIHKSKRDNNKRSFYNTIDVDNHDSFSVCEGEPLYKIKKARTGSDNDRMVALLSSLTALAKRYAGTRTQTDQAPNADKTKLAASILTGDDHVSALSSATSPFGV